LRNHSDAAAVLVEPIAGNMGVVPSQRAFLEMLREETKRMGALLVFDEVINGFRVGLNGAQGQYGITPDLTCLAKIIGGGFPVGAFGGKKEIMQHLSPIGPVYQAGTLSGNPVAMTAGAATLKVLAQPGFYEELQRKSDLLLDPISAWIKENNAPLCLNRVGSMFTLFFGVKTVNQKEDLLEMDASAFQAFFQHLFHRGIYLSPSPYEASFVSIAHTDEHLLFTQDAILSYLKRMTA
jgi:glutamate-1-semialdehyde 2,1-aminomutase